MYAKRIYRTYFRNGYALTPHSIEILFSNKNLLSPIGHSLFREVVGPPGQGSNSLPRFSKGKARRSPQGGIYATPPILTWGTPPSKYVWERPILAISLILNTLNRSHTYLRGIFVYKTDIDDCNGNDTNG